MRLPSSDQIETSCWPLWRKTDARWKHASAELQAGRGVVLATVAQNGYALEHASAELQADRGVLPAAARGVVLAAVAQNGCALEHASSELQAERGVVQAAAESRKALKRASSEL